MKMKYSLIMVVILIVGIVALSGCTSNSSTNKSTLNVTGVTVTSSGYGFYDVTGTITPNKNYSYLEMVIKWYDAQGNVIQRSPLAWNINEAKAGESIKFDAKCSIPQGSTPVKFDLMIFDSAFSGGDESNAIYKTSMNMG